MQDCALSQRRSASAKVSTPWCHNVHSLVPQCLGAEVYWGRTVRTLRHWWLVSWSLTSLFSTNMAISEMIRHLCRSVLVPKCLGSEVSGYPNKGYQSTRHTVISSHGHVVTRSTRHRSTRHTSISSHSQLVTIEHIGLTKPPVIIFGRPFVKRSPYAIGSLSVGAGHIVSDGFPALRERGTAPPPL